MTEYDPGDSFAADKLAKRRELRDRNTEVYPHEFEPTATLRELERQYDGPNGAAGDDIHTISGRVVTTGRTDEDDAFVDITDGHLTVRVLLQESSHVDHDIHRLLDPDDLVGATGTVARVQQDTVVFDSSDITVLSKTLFRPPEQDGPGDQEVGSSDREDGLTGREGSSDPIAALRDDLIRSKVDSRYVLLRELRSHLAEQGFVEVETPLLQNTPNDTDPAHFETYLDATDEQVTLRRSKSVYHSRLIAGGFERIFEVGTDFRPAASTSAVTSLELHQAYTDCEDVMTLAERMVSDAVTTLHAGDSTVALDGREVDFGRPWTRLTMSDAIDEYTTLDASALSDGRSGDRAQQGGSAPSSDSPPEPDLADIVERITPQLTDATFLSGYQVDTAPSRTAGDAGDTGCVEVIAGGEKLATLFTVPQDPLEVARGVDDSSTPQDGDGQARSSSDADRLQSLAYGIPPTAGVRLDIDRLSVLLTDSDAVGAVRPFQRYDDTS